jgi:hypothetical protein
MRPHVGEEMSRSRACPPSPTEGTWCGPRVLTRANNRTRRPRRRACATRRRRQGRSSSPSGCGRSTWTPPPCWRAPAPMTPLPRSPELSTLEHNNHLTRPRPSEMPLCRSRNGLVRRSVRHSVRRGRARIWSSGTGRTTWPPRCEDSSSPGVKVSFRGCSASSQLRTMSCGANSHGDDKNGTAARGFEVATRHPCVLVPDPSRIGPVHLGHPPVGARRRSSTVLRGKAA